MAGETVLVVEDEPAVRRLVRAALEEHGYLVVEAEGGEAALELARAYAGPIDLLLTDVLLPRIRGTELAPLLLARRPRMRVLFMSAWLGDATSRPEPLLEKPFTLQGLAKAVRMALEQPQAA
jgi:CheY-like chemotaxis protein